MELVGPACIRKRARVAGDMLVSDDGMVLVWGYGREVSECMLGLLLMM